MSNIINKTKELIAYYLKANYEIKEINILQQEIETILGESLELKSGPVVGYDTLQEALGSLNEKEYFRKSKGVYYTPQDVVNFIINNSIRLYDDSLISKDKCVSNMWLGRVFGCVYNENDCFVTCRCRARTNKGCCRKCVW